MWPAHFAIGDFRRTTDRMKIEFQPGSSQRRWNRNGMVAFRRASRQAKDCWIGNLTCVIPMLCPHLTIRTLLAATAVMGFAGCSATRSSQTMPVVAFHSTRNEPRAERAHDWNEWADAHLQDGDIVFMRGECYLLLGTFNFSDVSTDIADSRFSHIGLVAIENGQAYVYDLRTEGCLRTRFGELVTHPQLHQLAIKRHREASPAARSQAAAFCRTVFEKQEKYDSQLKLNNDRLYCSELIEQAYRSAGYQLSEPIAIQDLPGYHKHLKSIQFVRAVTSIEPDQPVLLPGNDQFGIWANPALELILDLPDTTVRPNNDK
jgi:permuted papain-like amidase YaeF/Yiix C92 family enzyme